MLLSVNQLSELTGRDRHGIPKRLENLPFTPGEKGAPGQRASVAPGQGPGSFALGEMVLSPTAEK